MLVDRSLQQARPLPQTRVLVPLGSLANDGDRSLFVTGGQRPFRQIGQGAGIRARFLERRRSGSHKPSAAGAPSASISSLTASRSISVKSGCQQSKMKTIRSSFVGFIASCSIVSSNTNASPFFQ